MNTTPLETVNNSVAARDRELLRSAKPPTPLGQIQATLKRIHNCNDHGDEHGPHVKGLRPDGWVVVASRGDCWHLGACMALLHSHDIRGRISCCRGDFTVDVAQEDFDAASKVLATHRRALYRGGRPFPLFVVIAFWAVVGGLVGLFPGLLFALARWRWNGGDPQAVAFAMLTSVALGMMLAACAVVYQVVCELLLKPQNPSCAEDVYPQRPQTRIHVRVERAPAYDLYPALFCGLCGFVLAALLLLMLSQSGWMHSSADANLPIFLLCVYGGAFIGAICGAYLCRTKSPQS
jgi:hypothetical protein